jgi:hypothetical protein
MKSILRAIQGLSEGTEKDFLLKTFNSAKKYINLEDEQSLEIVIARLNGLYDGMSRKAQEISLQLVNEIMEAIGKV